MIPVVNMFCAALCTFCPVSRPPDIISAEQNAKSGRQTEKETSIILLVKSVARQLFDLTAVYIPQTICNIFIFFIRRYLLGLLFNVTQQHIFQARISVKCQAAAKCARRSSFEKWCTSSLIFFTFASVLPPRCTLLLRETLTSFTAISTVGSPDFRKTSECANNGLLLVSIKYVSVIIYVITRLTNGDWAFKLPLIQRAGKKVFVR